MLNDILIVIIFQTLINYRKKIVDIYKKKHTFMIRKPISKTLTINATTSTSKTIIIQVNKIMLNP